MIGNPVRYDFPAKMRGPSSAERELRRLERSMAVAHARRDAFAFAYLDRRHKRARQALHTLRSREAAEAAPGLGSSRRAQARTHAAGGDSGDR